ncbi:thiamine-phosphate kinase [Acinetobacter larvae]|uniref:Thiamine-monophosphate kinase n=1 Tax=Acinetobacter larvae TaxID=1789224 RepID=A0A1B2M3J7_9GAMM|nr:thiamine-phosphate kinase [Acinetobacter larvae]AOA59768.1 thiamine-phosphate kinase [Acinetobacter larvae]
MAEFSIIETYFNRQPHAVDVGIGDDSAVIQPPSQQQLVICTDTLISGRHFPTDTAAHAVGWKSVAVNLSDIAAMAATPHSILLALSLPSIDHAWLQGFSDGLYACCEHYGVSLIGGDTTQSPHLTISVTALGWVAPQTAVTRSNAQVGDLIVVSGTVGDAAFALQHLGDPLQQRLDYPTPRCVLGQQLNGLAHSMIDISDGLAQDLQHILTASHCGACIELSQLPLSTRVQALPLVEQWQYALTGGDDYELCFTLSKENYQKLLQRHPDVQTTVIGQIIAQPQLQFMYQGQAQSLKLNGYQHFASE